MRSSEIACAHCGWRNESTARMCGGCGQPLLLAGMPVSGAGSAPDAPTTFSPSYHGAPTQAATPLAPGIAPWPSGSSAASTPRVKVAKRRPSVLKRALIVIGVVLFVLVFGSACAWAAVIRPVLHQAVDQQIRTELTRAIEQVPTVPAFTYPITADAINAVLQSHPPSDPKLQQLSVHFIDGYLVLNYTYDGNGGSIKTQLYPSGGGVRARATVVDGPLAVVETGDEMEAALNAALAYWPKGNKVKDIQTHADALFITIGN